jgi:anti-sigma B factor antagonist/stage II sporulation protein AA (anti-sigma F factor antagonist)
MSYDQIVLNGALVIAPREARIDLDNAETFTAELLAALAKTPKALIVDLSSVEYISSAGLRSLMIARNTAKAQDSALAVAALRPLTREIFAISRFDIVFTVFGGVREAIESLAPQAVAEFDAL